MKPLPVTDFGSNRSDNIMTAVETIGRSKDRLQVFLVICKGKKKEKNVSWIYNHTDLKTEKRVLEEAKELVDHGIIEQLDEKIDGKTAYKKIPFYCKNRTRIITLVKDPLKRKSYPTKINPKVKLTTQHIGIKLSLPRSGIKTKAISIQEIDNFSKIKNMKSMNYNLERNEDDIKELFKKIAGEKGRFTDWPGEKNDLLTYLTMNGKKILVAFAFKGKSKKLIKKLRPMDMGKNGDQVERLFTSPAEVFFVQFVGQIDDSMLNTMEQQSALKSYYTGKKIYYGVIDGSDTEKIFSKYKK